MKGWYIIMAKMKNLAEDIVIMRMDGFSCEHIAKKLDVPIDWVNSPLVESMIQERHELNHLYGKA